MTDSLKVIVNCAEELAVGFGPTETMVRTCGGASTTRETVLLIKEPSETWNEIVRADVFVPEFWN